MASLKRYINDTDCISSSTPENDRKRKQRKRKAKLADAAISEEGCSNLLTDGEHTAAFKFRETK